jgi:hypothetical protein
MKGKVNLFSRLERVREGVSSKGLDGCDLDGTLYLDLGSGAMGTMNLKMVAGTMMPIELGYVTREYESPYLMALWAIGSAYCKTRTVSIISYFDPSQSPDRIRLR